MRNLLLCLIGIFLISGTTSAQKDNQLKNNSKSKINTSTLNGLKFRNIGPALTSGRIADIAVNPYNKSEFYLAIASGNVFKTTNKGISFTPIFDNYSSYSIACVAIDPNNTSTVWIGTGENNSQRSVGWGDGIYKSIDAGGTFTKMGLDSSEHIGKILIDPKNSDIVYVAVQGPLWASGGDRGLYKTTDGGITWNKSLYISDMTGVSDLVMDPRDNNVLYCASYQRRRHIWTLIDGGPESAIYKSTDAGATWNKLSSGLPSADIGRIGLAISPVNPDYLYAIIESTEGQGGFYKTTNRGATWQKQSNYVSSSPQYYQQIHCDPIQLDKVYSLETVSKVTYDGGKNWNALGLNERHVDDHALYIDPDNTDYLIIGGDGGLYESYDSGNSWRFFPNLPVTQFYRIQADNSEPFYWVYGGTQDNNSIGAPSRTTHNGGILNQDWIFLLGGDGFEPQIDPENPNIIYAQWQHGNIMRYDKKSGELTGIKPQEEDGEELRWNWDTPLIISPHNPKRLYVAANKIFMSNDRGNSWTKISEDLTKQIDRNTLKVMDKIWSPEAVAKNQSTSLYGNILSIAESPKKEGLLYIGTDDGLIQVTDNNGNSWTKIENISGVPSDAYVSDIYPSRHSENVVYASFNNFKNGDFKPYILKSNDKGKSWTSIASNLPINQPVWTIEEDTEDPNLLFVGTEFGLFYTNNGGKSWIQLKSGLPTIAIRDLDIMERENDLVVGTFGRGIYILDDYSALREFDEELAEKDAFIFPIKDALMFVQDESPSRRNEGETFYRGENHPYGAVITYYLKDVPKTKKQIRKEEEKKLIEQGKTINYPTFAELRAEDLEESAYLLFTIRDKEGNIIRRLKQNPSKGINRIVWDMSFPSLSNTSEKTNVNVHSALPVAPGEYSVSMELVTPNEIKQLSSPEKFTCKPLNNTTLPANDINEVANFNNKIMALSSAINATKSFISDMQTKTKSMRNAVLNTRNADLELIRKADNILNTLNEYSRMLSGDRSISKRAGNQSPSIANRVEYITYTIYASTSNPTKTNQDSYKIASDKFEQLLDNLKNLYDGNFRALIEELDNSISPWTSGRFPNWKR